MTASRTAAAYAVTATTALLLGIAGNVEGRRAAVASLQFYQRALAPAAARVGLTCRLTPSCSHYGIAVIARDGVVLGGWRTLRRIARCGPWVPVGTRDDP